MSGPADWQLPPGVNRGLWDYLHDPEIAAHYDASLANHALVPADQGFAERHLARPGRLLDLGCGTGRLLLPFARRGYWVLGVDLSADMLRVTGRKAAAADVPVHLVQANLVDLNGLRSESFDYAACLFSTLGMVMGTAARRRVVEHAHRLLRPGGKFILHVHNRWHNLWTPGSRDWVWHDLLRMMLRRADAGDRVMPVHQGIAGLTLHLFTRGEVETLLRNAGFRILEVGPISYRADGTVRYLRGFGWLRAHGYLIAAERETASLGKPALDE